MPAVAGIFLSQFFLSSFSCSCFSKSDIQTRHRLMSPGIVCFYADDRLVCKQSFDVRTTVLEVSRITSTLVPVIALSQRSCSHARCFIYGYRDVYHGKQEIY